MLDIIRRKARTWIIKVIFGIIIIVFALFFGYNRISQKYSEGGGVVASVDGTPITRPEFQLAYDNTYRMYQRMFKGKEGEPLPPEMERNVKSGTIHQLIQQKIIESLGRNAGVEPVSVEIIDSIRSSEVAKGEDGKFDPYLYKQRFLPYFSRKYNMDYEYLIASDLLVKHAQDIFDSAGKAPLARERYNMERTKWSFDVTEYDSVEAAKKGKNKPKKIGPITLGEKNQLFQGEPDANIWESIFMLTEKNPSLSEPIHVGEKWYKVKLAKIETPSDDQWQKESESYKKTLAMRTGDEFRRSWIDGLLKGAKVETFMEE